MKTHTVILTIDLPNTCDINDARAIVHKAILFGQMEAEKRVENGTAGITTLDLSQIDVNSDVKIIKD